MKKRIITISIVGLIMFVIIIGKAVLTPAIEDTKISIADIKETGRLAALKIVYHYVISDEMKAGTGITHIGEKDKEFWVEFDSTVEYSINVEDMQVSECKNNKVTIYLPEVKVSNPVIDKSSYKLYEEKGGWNEVTVTQEKQQETEKKAVEEILNKAQNNEDCRKAAKNRVKSMIENMYKVVNPDIEITWKEFTEENSKGE